MPNTDNKLIHVQAANLARRWSVQNENDLVQEDMFGNSMDIGGKKNVYDHDYCQELASHMVHMKSLPSACMQFQDVVGDLKRRDSDTTHATQFLG